MDKTFDRFTFVHETVRQIIIEKLMLLDSTPVDDPHSEPKESIIIGV